ncbi:hypothetical protein PoB_002372100 [Plakobranchus ocellatus]|uniref:Uncharacterized protein n=1 Tax=Plakobranchus ocellatus TaxID=259542 RepID=A0AAV3ZML8_9GAST|nr:hypothetical protein PoB_002372100 [Plakobranchus ocellatus]
MNSRIKPTNLRHPARYVRLGHKILRATFNPTPPPLKLKRSVAVRCVTPRRRVKHATQPVWLCKVRVRLVQEHLAYNSTISIKKGWQSTGREGAVFHLVEQWPTTERSEL